MRRLAFALTAVMIVANACTGAPGGQAERPSPRAETETVDKQTAAEIEIYAAVIRRLVTKDHTFGTGPSPFEYIYVVNGPIEDAGDPLGDHFGPASEPFPKNVVDGIEQELRDLSPVRFITDGREARRGKHGMGGVTNDGVIISLGPIERNKGRISIGNGLWCGGTCGQRLTYVLTQQDGKWKITGTTGPYAIS